MVKPVAALFYLGGAASEDAATSDINVGLGATDGESQWAFATFANDGGSTMVLQRFAVKDGCIIITDGADITAQAHFVDFIEDGIRIHWDLVSGSGHKGFVVFFSGPTMQAKAGVVESPEQTGRKLEDIGFRSELILAASTFLQFAHSENRFGISTGFYFTGDDTAKRAMVGYAGVDGDSTSVNSDAGAINRKHLTKDTEKIVLADVLDGAPSSPLRASYDISLITGNGFTVTALNSLAAVKDLGYLALNFKGRARLTRTLWDLSNKEDGTYTQVHGSTHIENLEAVFAFPVAATDGGDNANVGLFAFTGDHAGAVFGRGSASFDDGPYEKTSMSAGSIDFPSAVTGGSGLTITPNGWTDGFTGWSYILTNAPDPDRTFECLVIGRVNDCYPVTWEQAQLMEAL
jgi:hypothetical protein